MRCFQIKPVQGCFLSEGLGPLKIFPVGTEVLTARACSNACAVLQSSLSAAVVLCTRPPDDLSLNEFHLNIVCFVIRLQKIFYR